ncbi:MAG: carbamate kinase [Lachnospiraceae bacterium]|nr:carbamate kinase [Lachnospiraceae bacterium]MBQ7601716.1 carbamate kinase [Lachnospiraceae bacterium]
MSKAVKVIVALGGNALQESKGPGTAEAQLEVAKRTCEYIADIIAAGYEIAIVHGNGPQVGRIILASETAKNTTPVMPFDVCSAMSQGYIGYHVQQALQDALRKRGRADLPVVTLITQVAVDPEDPAFRNPTKPIGPFYSEEEAKELAETKGYTVKEDAGRGWRRVVASPIPKKIVELDTVKRLWDSSIVITCGGGGIPVVPNGEGGYDGTAAVIDKDFAASLLARSLDADILLILTEVEKVSLNFRKPDQKDLDHITVEEARKFIEEGHFAPGSMLPKVKASVDFAVSAPGRKAIITSLYKAVDALQGKTGTVIEA